MKKVFLATTLVLAQTSFASNKVCCNPPQKEQKPEVVYKTKWKTKVVEKKVPVYRYVPVETESDSTKNLNTQKPVQQTGTVHKSRTGNQKVIIQMNKNKKRKHRRRRKVRKTRVLKKKNRLQLLVGQSRTNQTIKELNCCDIEASVEQEIDLGVQYTRDFKNISGSITGTVKGNYYLGIGANW